MQSVVSAHSLFIEPAAIGSYPVIQGYAPATATDFKLAEERLIDQIETSHRHFLKKFSWGMGGFNFLAMLGLMICAGPHMTPVIGGIVAALIIVDAIAVLSMFVMAYRKDNEVQKVRDDFSRHHQ